MDFDKKTARASSLDALRATAPEQRAAWSTAMRAHLQAAPAWRAARTVMLFAALRCEPDLLPLLTAEKRCVFPSLENDRIVPRAVATLTDLVLTPHGIREPDPARCPIVPAEEIDLILVPGLAFTRAGTRLGRGRGHYDRFLPAHARRAGVCFACQVCDTLPAEPHDVPMHALLTENGLAFCGTDSALPAA